MKNIIRFYKTLGLLSVLLFSCTSQKNITVTPPSQEKMPPITSSTPESITLSPTPVKNIPIDERVIIGELPNGLKYYIQKNKKPENRAELRLALMSGSMQEDEDQLGLAHFIEHMAFNGSAHFKKNELVDYLESTGARFGPDLNAYTSFDETVYMLQVRTDNEEQMQKGLLVLEDWAGAITFEAEEIDKERGVVVSEWRSSLSPDQRMQQQFFPVLYQNSRYAKRMPIGKPQIINNATYETIRRYYKDWYRPNLMAVVAIGDFDVKQMEMDIKERFSKLKNPTNPRERKTYSVPNHPTTLVSICSDKEAAFTRVRVVYKHKSQTVKTLQDFRKQIAFSLYNSMLNNRLEELTQIPNPPFSYASSGYGKDVGDLSTYSAFAFVAEGGAQTGLEAVLTENERVLRYGFTPTELERTKLSILKNAQRALKEMDKTDSRRLAMKYVYHFLNDNPIPSPKQRLDLYQKYLPTIQLAEVNELAKKWITNENRVFLITGPEKKESPLPTQEDVLAILEGIAQKSLEPYIDQVSDAPLLEKVLSPTPIIAEKALETIDATELQLANGIRVVLKPTNFKNDEILMRSFSPGGTSLYTDEDYIHASSAASIVNESGVGTFDLIQLQKKLTGKKVSVYPSISSLYEQVSGQCSPEDLKTLFELTYLYFTAPRKDPEVLQSFITKQKSIYKNLYATPAYYFSDQSYRIKYNNHPRVGWPNAKELDEINLDKVMEIYKDRFADAGDFTFFFVGNFEIDAIKPFLATYLGNLPTTKRKEHWKDLDIDLLPGNVQKELTKGKAPKALIDITYHGDYPDTTMEEQLKFYLMTDVLQIKMRESLREDKGGVYSVRVGGSISKYPESTYSIQISFNSEPAQAKTLIQTAMEEIETIKQNGAEEKDLDKVKEAIIQSRTKNLKENSWWISKLYNTYLYKKADFHRYPIASFKEAVHQVTIMDIEENVKRYFNKDNRIEIVMMPEATQGN